MASIKLIDTGWGSMARGGTQFSVRANAGTAIDFSNTVSLDFRRGSGVEVDPEPGTASTTAQRISTENEHFEVNLRLRKNEASEVALLKAICGEHQSTSLRGIDQTDGVKALYIDAVGSDKKTLIEALGATSTPFHGNEVPTSMPAFFGFVKNVRAEDTADGNMWKVRFEFIST
jgi:hypothetical protein